MQKGKALEAILVVRLALMAAYVNDSVARSIMAAEDEPKVTMRTLISRLCGKRHTTWIATRGGCLDEDLVADFPDYSDFALETISGSTVEKKYADMKRKKSMQECNDDEAKNAAIAESNVEEPIMGDLAENAKAIVKKVSAFLAVWSDGENGATEYASKPKMAERLAENIAALNSPHFCVLSAQCPMNPGCGVALFFRVGERKVADEKDRRPKVLFHFETKYHASGSPTQDTAVDISREALHALNGVRQFVTTCNIRRVCFVHCSTAHVRQNVNAAVSTVPSVDVKSCAVDGAVVRQQNPFLMVMRFAAKEDDPSHTLNDMMCKLGTLGCTSSLHTVSTEEEWRNLLDSLYLIVPDMDESGGPDQA